MRGPASVIAHLTTSTTSGPLDLRPDRTVPDQKKLTAQPNRGTLGVTGPKRPYNWRARAAGFQELSLAQATTIVCWVWHRESRTLNLCCWTSPYSTQTKD